MKIMARRRKSGGVIPLKVDGEINLGTLADEDVLSVTLPTTVSKDTFLVSADIVWARRNATVGEGPVLVGMAHSDYTDAEIEEAIEATGSWDQSDKIAQEQARRLVRQAGGFQGDTTTTDEILNNGNPKRTKLRFVVQNGKTLKMWAKNKSGAALTTGSYIEYSGTIWARR